MSEEKTQEKEVKEQAQPKKQQKYYRTAKGKRRVHATVPRGRAYIHASLNNTIVSITDQNGNVLAWASAGNCGFRGPKKATPYAAGKVVEKVLEQIERLGMKELCVFATGIGNGRDSALRSLNTKGLNITSIKETTPVPHNGCRSRRPRRV
ncbi:30S ribosomal protein S11 [Candidatus Uhrbacteria bacterium]|jgi:small subunit ribosomal protein S11|nr:30S ribosomal protein S11 [Candidatus Uhrbacteria bacterium]MBT7717404.1 30S ribosomal protein S11 [Candidatus Uhrbacteria bacterium]